MPSGAKKRKAAKKKKENQDQSNNPSDSVVVHPHGDENVKGQDDVESNVEEIEKDSKVIHPSSVEGSRIEKEIKIEDELGKNDGITNPNEEIKKSSDGDSSGSSSSSSTSSDDESHGIKKDESKEGQLEGSGSLSEKTVETTPTTLDQNESVMQENDDRNGAQHMKDALLSQPLAIQKTSWRGCCGLFEVFSAPSA